MDDRKIRIIENALVCCYENRMKVRSVNGTEEYECKTKEEIDEKKTLGVYVVKNGTFYSILRSEGTLYLIIDDSIYDIKESMLEFSYVNIDDEWRLFEVNSKNKKIASLKYPRIKDFEDNRSKEDDLDIFVWISKIYTKGRLDNIL